MAGYCTSGQIYLREPKVSENMYNIQPYSTYLHKCNNVFITHLFCSHKFYQLPHGFIHNNYGGIQNIG